MINYNISINEELAQIVEQKIKKGKYANRSEFFREALRKLFVEDGFDVELIKQGTSEHKRLEKISQKKENFYPYSSFRRELGLN